MHCPELYYQEVTCFHPGIKIPFIREHDNTDLPLGLVWRDNARMILNGVDFDVLSLPPPSHNCEFSEGDKRGKVIKWG